MTIRFDSRVVIVTGAGQGLGRAYALAFAKHGATVVVNDIGPNAEAVAEEIRTAGGTARAEMANVVNRTEVAGLLERTMAAYGRVDVLVNNAGILRDRSFTNMSDAEWDNVLAVHLTGSANMSRAVWPVMREAGYGRIVMATSSTGLFGNFGQANYGAAKLGLVGLMNTLGIEGEKYDIRVNAVAPIALTRMTADLFPDGAEGVLEPERVAPAVLFLASDDAPNRAIVGAGGGAYAAARIEETPPVALGADAGPDAIAANWHRIADFGRADMRANGNEQTLAFFRATAKASNRAGSGPVNHALEDQIKASR